MKNTLLVIVALLVGGCGKSLEEKVVGTYEHKQDGPTIRAVLLDNGIVEFYENGKKEEGEGKWEFSKDTPSLLPEEGELHMIDLHGEPFILRINKDGSLTAIATMSKDGEREGFPKEYQTTFKKIK